MVLSGNTRSKLFVQIIFSIWLCLILSGAKEYVIWNQIVDILEAGGSVHNLFESGHVHMLRFLLVYPSLLLSELLTLPPGLVFSVYIYLLNVLIYVFIQKFCNHVEGRSGHYPFILFCIFVVNFFMNGRIIFAFLGSSLLLYTFYFSTRGNLGIVRFAINVLLSLFLMSVSTGAFMVGVFALIFYTMTSYLKGLREYKRYLDSRFIIMVFILLLMLPLMSQFLEKNLSFYNWDLYSMLGHGFGRVFYSDAAVIASLLISPFVFLVGYVLYHYMMRRDYLLAGVPIVFASSLIGMFGHSAFLSTMPVVIALFYLLVVRRLSVRCKLSNKTTLRPLGNAAELS